MKPNESCAVNSEARTCIIAYVMIRSKGKGEEGMLD
jgi:hypothetical protein